MTFDPENKIDPLRRGFHALESLNEQNLAPEMGLHPHSHDDIEIITYVREGTLIHQDGPGGIGYQRAGEFQHTSVCRGVHQRALNGSSIETAHVFQCCFTPGSITPRPIQEQKRFPVADREGIRAILERKLAGRLPTRTQSADEEGLVLSELQRGFGPV